MSFSWVSEMRKEGSELKAYVIEVEARLETALRELSNLSAGLVDADLPSGWFYDTKLKVSAARALERIAKKPCRQRPWTGRF